MGFKDSLERCKILVNSYIDNVLDENLKPYSLYDAARHLIKAGGKRLRPFLVIESCKLVNGDEYSVLPAAVAVELIHNFTLVHDDIMDEDELRRGVPTVHILWNVPLAILAGDLLFSKAFEVLFECCKTPSVSPERVLEAAARIASSVSLLAEGQAMDVDFEGRLLKSGVSEEEYLNMIYRKTAVLMRASCEVGALIGGGCKEAVNALARYGENIGMAFQMRDDLLGVIGKEEELGKPVGSDLREGKCTLIFIHAFNNASSSQKRLLSKYYGRKSISKMDLESVVKVLREIGSIDYVASLAKRYVSIAKEALLKFDECEAKNNLLELADYIVVRTF